MFNEKNIKELVLYYIPLYIILYCIYCFAKLDQEILCTSFLLINCIFLILSFLNKIKANVFMVMFLMLWMLIVYNYRNGIRINMIVLIIYVVIVSLFFILLSKKICKNVKLILLIVNNIFFIFILFLGNKSLSYCIIFDLIYFYLDNDNRNIQKSELRIFIVINIIVSICMFLNIL